MSQESDPNHFFSCSYNFLNIYDGRSLSSPLLAGPLCTTTPANIITSGNVVYLHLHTDDEVRSDGFSITWTSTDATSTNATTKDTSTRATTKDTTSTIATTTDTSTIAIRRYYNTVVTTGENAAGQLKISLVMLALGTLLATIVF